MSNRENNTTTNAYNCDLYSLRKRHKADAKYSKLIDAVKRTVAWGWPLNILYAVLSPITGLATMGWGMSLALRENSSVNRETLVILFQFSMIGVCLMLKWANMSIDALWHVNALPILAVMVWWFCLAIKNFPTHFPVFQISRIGNMLKGTLLLFMIIFLFFVQDPRNPTLYGLRAFRIYPSFLLSALKDMPHHKWAKENEAPFADVALISKYANPQKCVTLISDYDWVFLLAAERPPKIPWLPSTTIYYFPFLIDKALRNTGPIFLDKNILERIPSDNLFGIELRKHMRSDYKLEANGERLKVYTRYRDTTS